MELVSRIEYRGFLLEQTKDGVVFITNKEGRKSVRNAKEYPIARLKAEIDNLIDDSDLDNEEY
jgi:hypothetical protein